MDQCLCEWADLLGKAVLFLICIKFKPSAQLSRETLPSITFCPFPWKVSKLWAALYFFKKKKKKTWIGNRFTVFKPHSDFSEMPGGQSCPLRSPHPSHSPCPHSEITCLLVSFVSFLCVSLCKYNPVFLALFLSPGVHVLHTHSPHCFFHLAVCPEKTGTQWS